MPRFSSLDVTNPHYLAPGRLVGVRLQLNSLPQYSQITQGFALDDDALLGEIESELSLDKRKRKTDYGNFLRPTQYDEHAVLKTSVKRPEVPVEVARFGAKAEVAEVRARDNRIAAIEKQFEDARIPLQKHPDAKKAAAGVHPVKSIPVYPNFSLWGCNFLLVQFEESPLDTQKQRYEGLTENERAKLDRAAITVGYTGVNGGRNYLSYLVPKPERHSAEEAGGASGVVSFDDSNVNVEGSLPYEVVREYDFDTRNRDLDRDVADSYFLTFDENSQGEASAEYFQISSKLTMHKRPLTTASGEREDAPEMTVKRMRLSEPEITAQKAEISMLCQSEHILNDAALLEED
eukprot:CAMPEP_0182448970 /NCGR_PEP_ID=MMETSP1172-20130603/31080_1 /TAXON_ID=708627 /ORGANISM="Timspurckia oligopyrenoides, Strain CCMP3278" /LENGTH=347 /DNA_ID=CAMNT_0024646043 /DNA_START=123 /DNA_END=1166 /DNA_ORIENTATION=-